MKIFNGKSKNFKYFEGWYFKNQNDYSTLAIIPGINIDKIGVKYAFIQLITDEGSSIANFKFTDFKANKDIIKIGDNIFSPAGLSININDKIKAKGSLFFDNLTPLKYDIMGPFKYVPFMECKHRIISLNHNVSGEILVNGNLYEFNRGMGYIESDYGKSFPKSYLWLQCNKFKDLPCCISLSIADIPFLGGTFKGCICIVYYNSKEYRLSTYNGVKIIDVSKNKIVISQGKYRLEIEYDNKNGYDLHAPNLGYMNRIIKEAVSIDIKAKFSINNTVLFNLVSDMASFEYVSESL